MRRKERAAGRAASISSELDAVRTVRQFDEVYTAPYFGFDGADDYYHRASALRIIDRIRVPALVITAEDDPFVPPERVSRPQGVGNPHIELAVSPHGGHCGFRRPTHPGRMTDTGPKRGLWTSSSSPPQRSPKMRRLETHLRLPLCVNFDLRRHVAGGVVAIRTVTSEPFDVARPATLLSEPVTMVFSSYLNSISAPDALLTENVIDCGLTRVSSPVIAAGSGARSRSASTDQASTGFA